MTQEFKGHGRSDGFPLTCHKTSNVDTGISLSSSLYSSELFNIVVFFYYSGLDRVKVVYLYLMKV